MAHFYPIHFSQNAFLYAELAARGSWSGTYDFELPTTAAVQDDERVVHALNELLDRHEALRHTFVRNPKRLEAEDPDFWWHSYHQVALARKLPPRGFARFDSAADFPRHTRFRLTKPPYLRLWLADDNQGTTRARLDTTHIVADMWSCHILGRDLTQLLSDDGAPLPRAPQTYGQFAESEYQAFKSGSWEQSLRWWRTLLSDPPDHTWPASTGESGRAAWMVAISGASFESFRRHITRFRCSPFVAFASAYARAVARRFDWQRLTLLVLHFNRRPDTLNTVGQFANIFYLPVAVPRYATLDEIVRVVHPLAFEIVARHGHIWMKHVTDELPMDVATLLTAAPAVAIRQAIDLPLHDDADYRMLPGSDMIFGHKRMPAAEHGLDAEVLLDFAHSPDRGVNLVLTYDRSRTGDGDARQILVEIVESLTTDGGAC